MSKNKIYIVGMGPGSGEMMTAQAAAALDASDVIVGYPLYLELLGEKYRNKRLLSTPMRKEEERCRMCFAEAEKGCCVSIVCSGDAGVYGMASLMLEIAPEYPETELEVVPGVTAALSAAAALGAPLANDFCVISLSDILTPWAVIEKRLKAAAAGDFVIAIYNPGSRSRQSHLRRACDILKDIIKEERFCGIVENAGRGGARSEVCTLAELRDIQVNMFTTVIIGNSMTRVIGGRLVTSRGYEDTNKRCLKQ